MLTKRQKDAYIRVSQKKMTPETLESLKSIRDNAELVVGMIDSIVNGTDTMSNACRKANVGYMNFVSWLKRFYAVKTYTATLVVPKWEPTPEEHIYSIVFEEPVETVSDIMPDDAEETLEEVFKGLTKYEVTVICRRASGETLDEIARSYDVTAERIRQIERKGYRKLRTSTRKKMLRYGLKIMAEAEEEREKERRAMIDQINASISAKLDVDVIDRAIEQFNGIETLDLSVRAYNCLVRSDISTVPILLNTSPEKLMKIRNLGRNTLAEIIEKLKEHGYDLENSALKEIAAG